MAESYNAGNLEFKIQAMSSNSSAIFSEINSALTTMSDLLDKSSKSLSELSKSAKSMSRMTFNWTEKLAEGLSKIVNIDTASFENSMSKLTNAITPFVDKLTSAENSIIELEKLLKVTGKSKIKLPTIVDENTTKLSDSTIKNFSLNQFINKIYFLKNYTQQMARTVANIIQNGIDYTETLNMWQVAMRNNRQEAEKFVNTMNEAYGISTQTLMNYQAIFKNMLSSLGGVSGEISYRLSETITQMALDYASLFNTSIEKAMTTFQSMLSGSIRPIRSISGMDISENTIYQLYQALGGTKTQRQLTQTEKRLLRIYSVFQQMESTGVVGDLNRTLDTTANQLRRMSEQAKELGTWLGLILEPVIKPLITGLNVLLKVLTNVTKAFAKTKGLQLFESSISADIEDVNEGLEELNGNLFDFDKFSTLSSTAGGNIFSIDESITDAISKYTSVLDEALEKSTEIANTISKWFVDFDEKGNIVGLNKSFQETLDLVSSIALVLGSMLTLKLGITIVDFTKKILTLNSAIDLVKVGLETGIVYAVIKAIQLFKEGKTGAGILASAMGVGLVGALKLYTSYLKMAIDQTSLSTQIMKFLTQSVISLMSGIASLISGFIALKNSWSDMSGLHKAITLFGMLAGAIAGVVAGLKLMEGNWVGAIGVGATVAGIIASVSSIFAKSSDVSSNIDTPNIPSISSDMLTGTSNISYSASSQSETYNTIYSASYNGVKDALKSQSSTIQVNLDGKQIASANVNNTVQAINQSFHIGSNMKLQSN